MSGFWNAPAWSIPGKRAGEKNVKVSTDSPGPGEYANTVYLSKKIPSWKIGTSERGKGLANDQPGPGQYNLGSNNKGPKITMATKSKYANLDQNGPGPGNYNSNTNAISKNPEGYTMGSKYNSRADDLKPGPGAYNNSGNGNSNKKVGGKIGTSTRNGLGGNGDLPGPGEYTANRPFSAGPQYKFGAENKSSNKFESKPGPGQYETYNHEMTYKKGCVIGEKFSKHQQNGGLGPGPGSYNTYLQRPQSGAKIGRGERGLSRNFDTPGPGAYDSGYKPKKSTQIKIGSGMRGEFNKGETPGPGAYELLKNSRSGITISGHKVKETIGNTPGPGAYEVGMGPQSRPCSAKIGKSVRNNENQKDTPGPGQYYCSDSMKYKFAHTNQLRSKDLKKGDPGPGQYDINPTVPSAPPYILDNYKSKSKY